jgi:hypothetical protein
MFLQKVIETCGFSLRTEGVRVIRTDAATGEQREFTPAEGNLWADDVVMPVSCGHCQQEQIVTLLGHRGRRLPTDPCHRAYGSAVPVPFNTAKALAHYDLRPGCHVPQLSNF